MKINNRNGIAVLVCMLLLQSTAVMAQADFTLRMNAENGATAWSIQTGKQTVALPGIKIEAAQIANLGKNAASPTALKTDEPARTYSPKSVRKMADLGDQTAFLCVFSVDFAPVLTPKNDSSVPNGQSGGAIGLLPASKNVLRNPLPKPPPASIEVAAILIQSKRNIWFAPITWTAATIPEDENGCFVKEAQTFDTKFDPILKTNTITRKLTRHAVESVPYLLDCGCHTALQTRTLQTEELSAYTIENNAAKRVSTRKSYITMEGDTPLGVLRKAFDGPEKMPRMLRLNPNLRNATSFPAGLAIIVETE